MKNSILLICFSLLMILVTSCSEDEKIVKTYTVKVPAQLENAEVIAFLTDKSGKLLHTQKAAPGSVMTLEGGDAGEITLHNLIRLKTGPTTYRYKLDSYTNVPNKWNLNVAAIVSEPIPVGSHYLEVTGVPSDYTNVTFVGPNVQQPPQAVTGPNFTLQALLSKDNSLVSYLLIPSNNMAPRYADFSNASADDHETVEFSDMEEAEAVAIDFGMEAEQISVNQEAVYTRGPMTYFVPVAQYTIAQADHANVYTFPIDVVGYNKTTISFYADNAYYSYYRYAGPMDRFWYIEADVTDLNVLGNTLRVLAAGSYDYVTVRSQEAWNSELGDYTLQWNIQFLKKNKKSLVLPEIPQSILNEWPELSNAPINFDYAEVVEHVAHDGYLGGTRAGRIKYSPPPQDTRIKGRGFGSPVNPD